MTMPIPINSEDYPINEFEDVNKLFDLFEAKGVQIICKQEPSNPEINVRTVQMLDGTKIQMFDYNDGRQRFEISPIKEADEKLYTMVGIVTKQGADKKK